MSVSYGIARRKPTIRGMGEGLEEPMITIMIIVVLFFTNRHGDRKQL
jgi:hypothetical protein